MTTKNRQCYQCRSNKTYVSKYGFAQWFIKGEQWLCSNCHARLSYYTHRESRLKYAERYRDKKNPNRVRRPTRVGLTYQSKQDEERQKILHTNLRLKRQLHIAELELADLQREALRNKRLPGVG